MTSRALNELFVRFAGINVEKAIKERRSEGDGEERIAFSNNSTAASDCDLSQRQGLPDLSSDSEEMLKKRWLRMILS
jgi:hypothetical protein